jgi:hypothetical protein
MRIIVAGTIGQSGVGGQAWATLQYLLGFRALGHDVLYLEDCGECSWIYDWEADEWTRELDYPSNFVRHCLEPFGFANQWIYRSDDGSRGVLLGEFLEFCDGADLLIMRAAPLWVWRKEFNLPRRRVFIDVDPGFTQMSIANGDKGWITCVARADKRFTIGQRIGAPDCPIPLEGGPWFKTLPLVALDEWPMQTASATHFTSVIRWQGLREVSFRGTAYGQRDKEFLKYIDLPRTQAQKFCLAMMGTKPETLTAHGWEIVPGEVISKTPQSYREFIQNSRAEFSIPKHGYVQTRGGWFSDRSVCYLASGRPVLIEDTGLADWLPIGEGVVLFRNVDEAARAINEINGSYEKHSRAARRIAETVFAANVVLPKFIETAME